MKHRFLFLIILILLGAVFGANKVFAGTATVSWNANTESDLAGYKIYYGTSPRTGTNPGSGANQPLPKCGLCGYSTSVNVGNVITYTFTNLTNGATYYFSVSAYDTASPSNESAFSSFEVSKVITVPTGSADLNSDGQVNLTDFGIFLYNWGSTARPSADLNNDGIVNLTDFGIFLSQWTG